MTDTNFIRPTSWIHTPDKASGITGAADFSQTISSLTSSEGAYE